MSTADLAASLRAQADRLDELASAEHAATQAKTAYAANPSEDTKAAHRAAQQALRAVRAQSRDGRVFVPSDGSDVAIRPATIGTKTRREG